MNKDPEPRRGTVVLIGDVQLLIAWQRDYDSGLWFSASSAFSGPPGLTWGQLQRAYGRVVTLLHG